MHKTLDITDSSDGKTIEGRQTLWSLHRSFQPKCIATSSNSMDGPSL